jgi:hypothetical protein
MIAVGTLFPPPLTSTRAIVGSWAGPNSSCSSAMTCISQSRTSVTRALRCGCSVCDRGVHAGASVRVSTCRPS